MRSVINIDATVVNNKLPTLSVPQTTIDVAALQGIQAWPVLEAWAVNQSGNGFKDHITTSHHVCESGLIDNAEINPSVDGSPSYEVTASGDEIHMQDVDFTEGFTIAVLCGSEIGIGSRVVDNGKWFLASNALKLRWEIAPYGYSTYPEYDGPLLSETELNTVIFVFDRVAGEVYVRVNGQKCLSQSVVVDHFVRPELTVGAINVGTKQMRQSHYRAAVCFGRALSTAGIEAVETYLNSLKS